MNIMLVEILAKKVNQKREQIAHLLAEHSQVKFGEYNLAHLFNGERGLELLVSDLSFVDQDGLQIHSLPIRTVIERLPRQKGHEYPLTGGLYYYLLTGEMPGLEESLAMEDEWRKRMILPAFVEKMLRSMPADEHPMTMFSQAILAMQSTSLFALQYSDSLKREDYWKPMLEDALNLTARLPLIAAMIYNIKYRNGDNILPDTRMDWAGNFAHMIGRSWDQYYQELCRLFFILHADQGIGNVSGHTAVLVSSALSDIFYACSAAMNGLAGPLHGRANQDCLKWILEIRTRFGCCPSKEQLEAYIWDYLQQGKRIPGYGHPVIRTTDPRFTLQLEFGRKYMPEDELFRIVELVYQTAPEVLRRHSKVKNPYPNIDAVSGSLQYHCGVKEFDFYPVLFGVGRVLGISANLVWARALNMPLERPQSITLEMVEKRAKGLSLD
jgi:citrate synthase